MPAELSQTFNSSGKEVLGEEVTGRVTLINNYVKNQPLVATTRLLGPNGKLFRLKNTVNVPAGGKVMAEVYADEAKAEMAIGPSKFTIPGLWAGLQDQIYAQSDQPMKYSEKVKHIINQSDIDLAVSKLKEGLLAKVKEEASKNYGEYDELLLQLDNNSISQEVQGKVGEEQESFIIKIKGLATVVAFKTNDVYGQLAAKLNAALADDKTISEFNGQSVTYALNNVDLKQGLAVVNVNFTARTTMKDGAKVIKKNNLTGLNEQQVKAYLDNLPEVSGYEIRFFPSFIRTMPKLVDRIEIVIKQ
ncbi:MAG: hypothetical protein PHS62_04060 [Patescibacteria group bacterium]|nr:hypothetical protein [Patescibacteria group bacterium]